MSGFEPIVAEAVIAEAGTSALAAEVMAPEVLAATAGSAGGASGLAGISGLFGTGLEGLAANGGLGTLAQSAVPTMAEQLVTANPVALGQLQNAVLPGMTPDQLAQITGGIPTAGPGVQVAELSSGMGGATPEMLDPSLNLPAGTTFTPPPMPGAMTGAPTPLPPSFTGEKSALASLMDKSKYLTKAKDWFDKQDNEDLALYGAGAGLGLSALTKKKKELGGASSYAGPLSRLEYNPDSYRPQELRQPNPYRARYAVGGTIEEMSNANAVGANTGYPMADIAPGAYATPYQQPISRNVLSDASDTGVNPMTGEMSFAPGGFLSGVGPMGPTVFANRATKKTPPPPTQFAVPVARAPIAQPTPYKARYAQGGKSQVYKIPSHMSAIDDYISQASSGDMSTVIAKAKGGDQNAMIALNRLQNTPNQNYAQGGISDLGGYSDGGRMLKGPGDGMSDNIPASIEDKQPARLANEEFVIPADVVSHLGNGSSEAGAKQLYKMMDRVRQARTGKKSQGKQIKADKYMPV